MVLTVPNTLLTTTAPEQPILCTRAHHYERETLLNTHTREKEIERERDRKIKGWREVGGKGRVGEKGCLD